MRKTQYFFVISFFIALGFYRFQPAFSTFHQTTAFPGDGWANIGGIFDIHDSINRKGITSLFSDTYYSIGLGGGLNTLGIPVNGLWQTLYWSGAHFLEPDNVYDGIAYLGWVLIGTCSFMLARTLGFEFILAFIFCLCIASIEAFHRRLVGHLGLATYFMPLVVMAQAFRYAEKPSRGNILWLAIALWLNFYVNEYFGYYGCFIATAIILPGLLINDWGEWAQRKFWKNLGLGFTSFCTLMLVSYPNTITRRIFEKITGTPNQFNSVSHHLQHDFYAYAAPRYDTAFSTRIHNWGWRHIVNAPIHGENTYSIGSLCVFIAIILPLLAILISFKRQNTKDFKLLWKRYMMLFATALVGISLSLHPDHPWSLVRMTMLYAPMFRVNVRALLFTDIAVIAMAFLGLQILLKHRPIQPSSFRMKTLRHSMTMLSIILATLCLEDIAGKDFYNLVAKFGTCNLGKSEEYAALDDKPDGLLLEIPFHTPGTISPEADYPYYIARLRHKKPLFNGGLPHKGDFHAMLRRVGEFEQWQHVSQSAIASMQKAGIRYIVCHKEKFNPDHIRQRSGVTEIADNEKVTIFELDEGHSFDYQVTRNAIWPSEFRIPIDKMKKLAGEEIPSPFDRNSKVLKAHRPNGIKAISIFGPYLPLETGHYRARVPIARLDDGNPDTPIAKIELSGAGIPAEAGSKILYNKDLSNHELKEFIFDFDVPTQGDLEIKIHTLSHHPVLMGESIVERPAKTHGSRRGFL